MGDIEASRSVKLVLPLPPSPNDMPKTKLAQHHAKNRYRKRVWAEAIKQVVPPTDPPSLVVLNATFYVRNLRDGTDNLRASLKWVLDALKQKQTGKLDWRQNAYDLRGYFVDDDNRCLVAGKITQQVERKCPRIEIELEAA